MALYTEKTYNEVMNPLKNYAGDNSYVKGYTNALQNGGDQYEYAKNYKAYKNALETGKANDNDNFFTKIGDFFVGRDLDKTKADYADEMLKQYNDYFEQNGYDNSILPYYFDSGNYKSILNSAKTEYNPDAGRYMNGGLIGAMVNPFTQVGKMGVDAVTNLAGGQTKERDWLSDLGAIGESALNLATGGGTNILKDLGKGAIKNIARDAAVGGIGSALNTVTQNGAKNFDLGNTLTSAALGGVTGAALGGALRGAGKLWNRYVNLSPSTDIVKYAGAGDNATSEYQNALNALKNVDIDTNSLGKMHSDFRKWAAKNHPDVGGDEKLFKQISSASDVLEKMMNGDAISSVANNPTSNIGQVPITSAQKLQNLKGNILNTPKYMANSASNLFSNISNNKFGKAIYGAAGRLSNSSVATKAKNILSTNAGKALAGVGGGFLLSKLLNGGNAQNNKFSDDELEMLAEYYYNNYGGQ